MAMSADVTQGYGAACIVKHPKKTKFRLENLLHVQKPKIGREFAILCTENLKI
jgi:hypothetical protein